MIHSLRHFALGVPDLATGADFYTAFGLNMRVGNDVLAFRSHGREHDEVMLVETGQARKFHHIAFATDAAGLRAIAAKLAARGIEQLHAPFAGAPDGLWFHDTDGNLVNVQESEPALLVATPIPDINRPGALTRLNRRGCPTPDLPALPRRLGHIILFTPDVPRQLRFYVEVLGMRLSDTIANDYAGFLRTAGDSDHHVLGLINSPAPGLHHASFEMNSVDETELGAVKLFGKGYRHAWGPGRHAIGSNYFHYFRDPWNGLVEYFYDIDFITEDFQWAPHEWTKKDGMFLWSADGPPPPDFGRNYEIE